ncbi:hypothetical protein WJX77_001887 [Trebouxia sp. C0004]
MWSAQFAGYGWMQAGTAAPGPHQCAACAAEIPEAQAVSRCSKCKLVHFCNRQCQLAAHPIHKHYCLQPGLRQYAHKTRVMLETALTEAEVLCEGVLIRPTLAGLLAVHEEGTQLPSAGTQIQYAAGSAAIALGEYYMSMNEPEEAWVYLDSAVDIAKHLKYYQLRSDAMKDQAGMLPNLDPDTCEHTSLQLCDKMLQSAERHHDIYLLAMANGIRADLTAKQGVGHGDAYSDASKGFWLDMMKACSTRGDAGLPGLQMAAERLISVHLAYSEELMATSRREHARAEAEVLEAQKYLELTLDAAQKMHLLMRLANNCELQASDADFNLREKAAGFRQELLVEMVNQEKQDCVYVFVVRVLRAVYSILRVLNKKIVNL